MTNFFSVVLTNTMRSITKAEEHQCNQSVLSGLEAVLHIFLCPIFLSCYFILIKLFVEDNMQWICSSVQQWPDNLLAKFPTLYIAAVRKAWSLIGSPTCIWPGSVIPLVRTFTVLYIQSFSHCGCLKLVEDAWRCILSSSPLTSLSLNVHANNWQVIWSLLCVKLGRQMTHSHLQSRYCEMGSVCCPVWKCM